MIEALSAPVAFAAVLGSSQYMSSTYFTPIVVSCRTKLDIFVSTLPLEMNRRIFWIGDGAQIGVIRSPYRQDSIHNAHDNQCRSYMRKTDHIYEVKTKNIHTV